jgi:hypothetical protein
MGNVLGGFANYSANTLTTPPLATDNITIGGNPAANLNNTTINSLRVTGAATVTMNAAQTLTLASGGLLTNTNNAVAINAGFLTSGGPELFATISQNTTTINSNIVNNGATRAHLVKTGRRHPRPHRHGNAYTGGTIANNGTLNLSTPGGNGTTVFAIPGDLIINGGGSVATTVTGQIKSTANLIMNGSVA